MSCLLGANATAGDEVSLDLEIDCADGVNVGPGLSVISGKGLTYRKNLAKSAKTFDDIPDREDSRPGFQDALLSLLEDM